MGHQHMPPLPQTRKWRAVVQLFADGADVAKLASATLRAADAGFAAAARDPGVIEAYWLLVRVPLAARAPDFPAALRELGLDVPDAPVLLDVAVAFSAAVDARMSNSRGRTDVGEMAQTAAVEALNAVAGPRAESLFGAGPDEARAALAGLATVAQFGSLARQFFARFTYKALGYFLGRVLPDQTGPGHRFRTLAQQSAFTDALRTHCHEASGCEERYAGEWFSLHKFQSAGAVTRAEVCGFWDHAVEKLTHEFRLREGARG